MARGARVCIVSLRRLNQLAAWAALYELEDLLLEIEDATLVTLQPTRAFSRADWLVQRLMWRRGARELARFANPGLVACELADEYDLVFFACMNPFDLVYLNALGDLRARCKTSVCFMLELWAASLDAYAFHLKALAAFDHVFLSYAGSVEPAARALGRACHHLSVATNALLFTPFPAHPPRVVDVYSVGRRPEWAHRALLEHARDAGTFYLHDTLPGSLVRPHEPVQHRALLANVSKRSRALLAFPAKVDQDDETRGQSEAGLRFYEGAAAGCALVGRAARNPAFEREFAWTDAVVPAHDAASLAAFLERMRNEPERIAAIGERNAREALRRHDWVHRWQRVLEVVGLPLSEAAQARQLTLAELAQSP